MDLSVVPYGEMGRTSLEVGRGGGAGEGKAADPARGGGGRYRECMRNHAAAIGGQAYDGCGEFMPGGDGGSLEALMCAACGCHRNFHRRDGASSAPSAVPRPPLLLPPPGFPGFVPHPMPLPYHQILPHPPAYDGSRAGSETPPRREEEQQAAARARKRHRTKFTAEQKEKMQAFAEKLGWRIQKHDDVALQEFCVEVGVKRHVLKVWMHNNKNSLSPSPSATPTAAAAKLDATPTPTATAQPIRV